MISFAYHVYCCLFMFICHTVIMSISIHSILYTAALGLARSDLKRTNYKIAVKTNINSPTAGKCSGTVYNCFGVSFIVRRNSFRVSAYGYLATTSQ